MIMRNYLCHIKTDGARQIIFDTRTRDANDVKHCLPIVLLSFRLFWS